MNKQTELIESIKFLNKFKHIQRLSLISNKGRRESDAEHTWHLVMTVWMLSEQYEKKIDINKAIKIALVHDLPEMLAGDVFAHADAQTKEQKKENEEKALTEIIVKLPISFGNEIRELWNEYENRKSEEAKFVWLADKLMPRVQQELTEGDLSDEMEYDKQEDINQKNKMSEMSELFKILLSELKN